MGTPLVIPNIVAAFGMFSLALGGDSLKVAHLGIRYVPFQYLTDLTAISYRAIGYSLLVVGLGLMLAAAAICRRADKRVVAAVPGISPPLSFAFAAVPGCFIGVATWAVVSEWLRT